MTAALGPEYIQDPHSVHDWLRADHPVAEVHMPDGMRAWLVTGYDDVRAALADPRLVKDFRKLFAGGSPDWQSAAER